MLDETVRQAPDEPLGLDNLAPGIQGYTVDCGEEGLYVPLIISTEPEKGNVGKYLDTLRDLPLVKIPNVTTGRLQDMLSRRGYVLEYEDSEEYGMVDIWVWRK
jgi:hypothetical protein